MTWRSAPYIGLLSTFLLMVASVTVTYAPKPAFAASVTLIGQVNSEPSTTLDTVFASNQIQLNYTSGSVWLSTCSDALCTWAIDDDARISVVHQDTSTAQDDFESRTVDKAPVDISYLLESGTNTITVELIDRIAPLRGLPRTLYLIHGSSPPPADLSVQSIPPQLLSFLKMWVGYSKDPVNTLTGSFTLIQNDLTISGRGPTPTFTRYYDSANDHEGSLGQGWTHNYETRLVKPSAMSNDIVVITSNGSANYYTEDSGDYLPPDGVVATLVKETSGAYTVTEKDLTRWEYDQKGRLMRIRDRYGNLSILTYDGSGRLASVGDPAGRGNLTFSYNGSQITEVTDWTNRVVSFGYDEYSRLETVTDRENNTTTFAYDSSSQWITTVTDANSNVVVTNTYDGNGRVSTQKDARGLITSEQTTFTYTDTGGGTQKTTITYPATSHETGWDHVEEDYYDADGRLVQHVSKPLTSSDTWSTETYTYNGDGFRDSFTDGKGGTTLYCFDVDYEGDPIGGSRGNLTREIKPSPSGGAARPTTLYEYDGSNNLIQIVTPNGVTSSSGTTCSTDLSASIDNDYTTNFVFNGGSNTLASVTQYFTDPDTGLKTVTTKYEYNDSANPGLPTEIISPRGNTGGSPNYDYATSFTYGTSGSQAGMLLAEVSPIGAETTYTYDSVGRMLSMTESRGNEGGATPSQFTWEYVYDNEDRLTFEKAPAPSGAGGQLVTEYQYDAVGNQTVVIDANGQVTVYDYDERDQLAAVHQSTDAWTNPNSSPTNEIITTYEYDHLYNLSRVVRADGSADERATDYAYDGLGRLITEKEYPSWPSTSSPLTRTYGYDKNGNRTSKSDALARSTTYTYDALNRLTLTDTTDTATSVDVAYTYDRNGNRLTMNNTIASISYTYDEIDRMVQVQTTSTAAGNSTVKYRYDLNGNRTKLIYPDNTEVEYEYDFSDRMTKVTDWNDYETTYDYLVNGAVEQVNHFNGATSAYAYDKVGRLTEIVHRDDGDDVLTSHAYTYDAVGNKVYADDVDIWQGDLTIDYTYDGIYRLLGEDIGGDEEYTLEYEYDDVGNRTFQSFTDWTGTEEVDFTYDTVDRITEADRGSVWLTEHFTVDANGSMTYRTNTTLSNRDWYYFDQEDRMVGSKHDNFYTYYYFLDGDGNRIAIKRTYMSVQNVNEYVHDVNRAIPVLLQDRENKYVYGLDLLYVEVDDDEDDVFVYHKDGTGSVRVMTDAFGGEDGSAFYDPYGIQIDDDWSADQPFKFAGEEYDNGDYQNMPQSGYSYLRARYYDSTIGRFVSRDSYGGNVRNPASLNRYAYAYNNPVNFTDPSGHDPLWGQILKGSLSTAGGAALSYGGGAALAAATPATGGVSIAGAVAVFSVGQVEMAIGIAQVADGFKGVKNETPSTLGIVASGFTDDATSIRGAEAVQTLLTLPFGGHVPMLIKSMEAAGNLGDFLKFWETFRLVPQAEAAEWSKNK